MEKRTKAWMIFISPFVVGVLLGFLIGRCSAPEHKVVEVMEVAADPVPEAEAEAEADPAPEPTIEEIEPQAKEIIYWRKRPPYAKMFADLNDAHLEVARKVGLKSPLKTRKDINTKELVQIRDNDYYTIYTLRYSVPYLTKNAAKELNAIGKAFSDSLRNHGLLDYKLVITSVLRTEEDVAKLRKSGNPNASSNSAHCYGTTFDITYTRYSRDDESEAFMQPYELTKVLSEVLSDRKKAGKILCKYEKQEHCFHTTVCY